MEGKTSFSDKLKQDEGITSQSGGASEGSSSFTDKYDKSSDDTKSFVDQMMSKSGHLIYHVTGKDATNGLDATYFILVDKPKLDAFKKAIETDNINLLDFGQIVASCYGKEPSERVKKIMEEKYGFEV